MEQKKTAMAELIDKLRDRIAKIESDELPNRSQKGAYVDALLLATSLLPQEREQMDDMWYAGMNYVDPEYDGFSVFSLEKYFNENYTQEYGTETK